MSYIQLPYVLVKKSKQIQEDLNAIVAFDEKFNNPIVRHALDLKNAGIFQNPNPLNLNFCNVKKVCLQNPIIGKLASRVKARKLTEDQLTKKKKKNNARSNS